MKLEFGSLSVSHRAQSQVSVVGCIFKATTARFGVRIETEPLHRNLFQFERLPVSEIHYHWKCLENLRLEDISPRNSNSTPRKMFFFWIVTYFLGYKNNEGINFCVFDENNFLQSPNALKIDLLGSNIWRKIRIRTLIKSRASENSEFGSLSTVRE